MTFSDYTIELPSISLLAGASGRDETVAVTVPAPGTVFASGTDSETITIRLLDHALAQNDFDGGGKSDILWRSDSGAMTDWTGLANGGFHDNAANAFTNVPTAWQVAGTGDFNGDGHSDILWRNSEIGRAHV